MTFTNRFHWAKNWPCVIQLADLITTIVLWNRKFISHYIRVAKVHGVVAKRCQSKNRHIVDILCARTLCTLGYLLISIYYVWISLNTSENMSMLVITCNMWLRISRNLHGIQIELNFGWCRTVEQTANLNVNAVLVWCLLSEKNRYWK